MLHRRLHVGYNLIKRLADSASDVPSSIKKGIAHDCEACKTAIMQRACRTPERATSHHTSAD